MQPLFQDIATPNGHQYSQPLGLFINNEFVPGDTGDTITSIDPASEDVIATVHAASEEDVDRAVRAARTALKSKAWGSMPGTERGILLARLADLVERDQQLLATIDAWDNGISPILHDGPVESILIDIGTPGKPYSVALGEDLPEAINTIRYYAGWCDKIFGQTIETTPEKFAYTLRQPVGVVAQIIPWNYPLSMAAWKLGPAIACGNTVVIKAAEQTPLSILMLGRLIQEAGFPPGVINIINGVGGVAGKALVQHPLVDKVAFTGSTATAKAIMAMAAKTLKNITLETGGKSPLLVFNDAELEQAVKWSHFGIMSNQGQICTATSRILVQSNVYDDFITKFLDAIKSISVIGNQWDETTFQGPQVSRAQYERILSYVETGKEEGATLLAGGHPCPINGKGFFISPTVFADVTSSMRIYQEEIFGPFVVISLFDNEEDAVLRANDSVYGLGASIFTENLSKAHRIAAEIESGTVWINSSQDCDFRIPFGGVKQSGVGRELGAAGLEAYTQIKAVHVNLSNRI